MAELILLEEVRYIASTDRAILIEYDGEEHWLPLSCVRHEETHLEEDDIFDIEVVEWFAVQEGLV